MKYTFSLLFVLALLSCNSNKKESSKTKERPNILVILCDDLGYNDVGFNGSTEITTPALDKLAENGTVFSSGYVAHPFCGPSRAALMTGRYPHTTSSQFNLPPNAEILGDGIPLSEKFMTTMLQESGYYTGVVGKWHLGNVGNFHPNKRGVDDFYGFLGGGHNYLPEKYNAAYARQKKAGKKVIFEYLWPLEHNGKDVKSDKYLTDELSDEAVRFVNNAKDKEKPFFLYLAYNAPHVPLEAKKEDMEKFAHIDDKYRRTYAGMVYAVDRGVDNIVKALKSNGQFENTLIVFFSDNGGKVSKGANNYPLREGKGSACEGGYRVPMFFHWPNAVPAGQKFDHPVTSLDFYPTFAALAKAEIPQSKILDGKNVMPHIIDGTNAHKGENIYVCRHRTGYSDVAIRRGNWKALKVDQKPWQLIDLSEDISESNDLSHKYPTILKNLVEAGETWSKTHEQPRWWHDEATGIEWKEKNMPRFDVTFKVEE